MSDTGLWGDSGTGIAADQLVDTFVKILSVFIWTQCALDTNYHCIPLRHSLQIGHRTYKKPVPFRGSNWRSNTMPKHI